MAGFDLTTYRGRLFAYLDFLWRDHAYLRLGFRNAHWVSDEFVRSNQPWPHQLRAWKRRGIRTIVNLRGGFDASFHVLEKQACASLGLHLVNFTLTSRDAPTCEQILAARGLFETVEYPVLIHCKSGADRASMMSALYVCLRLGADVSTAKRQLGLRYLHLRHGRTGILDYVFERYLEDAAPRRQTFLSWVQSPAYDPVELKSAFAARTRRSILADVLQRE